MYQLGHFLAEQKSILSSQQDMSLFGTQGDMFKYLIYKLCTQILYISYVHRCYYKAAHRHDIFLLTVENIVRVSTPKE